MSFYKEVPGRQTTLESTLKFDTTPTAGSTNPVTSDGVASGISQSMRDFEEVMYAKLSGTPAEVAAAALCELKYNQDYMAEEFAELDSRISALENAESVNANRTALSAPSIRKAPSVVIDPEVDAAVEREIKETPAATEGDEN